MQDRYRRRLTLWSILLVLLMFIAYFQFGLLPGKLQEIVSAQLESHYGQAIKFSRVIYIPFQGITIYDLNVKGNETIPDFTAKRLILQAKIIPYLRKRDVIITNAILDEPVLERPMDIKKSKDFLAVLSPVVFKLPDTDFTSFFPTHIRLDKLSVRRGDIFWMQPLESLPVESIRRLNLEVDFTQLPLIDVEADFRLGDDNYARLHVEAKWDPKQRQPEVAIKGHLRRIPNWLRPFLSGDQGWTLEDVRTPFELHLNQSGPQSLAYDLSTKKSNLKFRWNQYRMVTLAALTYSGSYNLANRTNTLTEGSLRIFDGGLEGLPEPIYALRNLRGRLLFDTERVRFENLEVDGPKMRTTLTGSLDLGKPRFFDIHINQKSENLMVLNTILPENIREWLKPEAFTGQFTVNARLIGDMQNTTKLNKSIKIRMENAEWLPPEYDGGLTQVNGVNIITDDRIQFENVSFKYKETPLVVDGHIALPEDQESHLRITHPKFTANSVLVYGKKALTIQALDVQLGKSNFRLSGVLKDTARVPVEITGKGKIDLYNLSTHLQEELPWLYQLKPHGQSEISLRVEGYADDRNSLTAFLRSDAPFLSLDNRFYFENIASDVKYMHPIAKLTYGKANVSDGEVRFNGDLDLTQLKQPRFQLTLNCQDLDLADSVETLRIGNKDFTGTLFLEMNVGGILHETNTYAGSGNFEIDDGHLFTTDIYKRLHKLLFLKIEGIEQLTFNRAEGTFAILDQAFHSEDTVVSSSLINLNVRGRVGFDKALQLNLSSRFTPYLIEESRGIGGFAPYLIEIAEQRIDEYEVTGSLIEPISKKLGR